MLDHSSPLDLLFSARQWIPLVVGCLWGVWIPSDAHAQRPLYLIDVVLDTNRHQLSGTTEIHFFNSTSQPVSSIPLHLYPNAYSRRNTAMDEQMLHLDLADFHFTKEALRGNIEIASFQVNGKDRQPETDKTFDEISWIKLDDPLQPGDEVELKMVMNIKVPFSFSRMGYIDQTYQLTQWYPHIPVLDEEGWHTMPYLDQGEFYNDFADYQVSLTVPKGYVIAATGVLNEKSEASGNTKWRFFAENVIDFAWFASPYFVWTKHQVGLPNGRNIELNVYSDSREPEYWEDAAAYSRRALLYYSDWLGPYPYPQMSVVCTPGSKGGLMEYPMVAQVSYATDTINLDAGIAHEIGHTWLYGILANNERLHPWMDEGLNTFMEWSYTRTFHPGYVESPNPKWVSDAHSVPEDDIRRINIRFQNMLQPPESDPRYQLSEAYLQSAYRLVPIGLDMILSRYGTDMMKSMLRMYFEDHKFSHVTPDDLRSSFESICDCDLGWFFSDWLQNALDIDYRWSAYRPADKSVEIKNVSGSTAPVQVVTYMNGQQVESQWQDSWEGKKKLQFKKPFDQAVLYPDFPSVNKKWFGQIRPGSWLPSVSILPKLSRYDRPVWSITPMAGYNLTDGVMPGLVVLSSTFPQRPFTWMIMPLYGTKSHALRGFATGQYISDMKGKLFDKWLISVSAQHFGYNLDTHYLFRDSYFKFSPAIGFRFNWNPEHPHLLQWLKYRYVHIGQAYGRGISVEDHTFEKLNRSYGVHELTYQRMSAYPVRPYTFSANVQSGKGFVRLNAFYEQHFIRKHKQKGVWVHGYAGWLPYYKNPEANVKFYTNGYASSGFFSTDYMYDQWLGGRNASTGFFGRQVYLKDAGLKTLATNGISEKWMMGAGASLAMPFRFLHLYMDAAFYSSAITGKTTLSYSGGVAVVLLKNVFEVYVPVLESKDIRESASYLVRDIWHKRISFMANITFGNVPATIDLINLGY